MLRKKIGCIGVSILALGMLVSTPLLNLPANALELGNKQTVFNKAPRLIRSATSRNSPSTSATYQFTIEVPENAGESLKSITITQKPNVERISFEATQSSAFIGDSFAGGTQLPLSSIGGPQTGNENTVTVVFDEPVEPGNTVTVSLKAKENPRSGGVYLFGVTAFGEGEDSSGLYLGSARLHFSDSN